MSDNTPKRKPRQVYAFIDTNIFLDFYRQSNEATLRLLERLIPVKDRILCTYQVEMEFLKNRQTVLLAALAEMKSPEVSAPPALFADSSPSRALRKATLSAKKRAGLIKQRAIKVLENPRRHDPVYQVLETIFQSTSRHVLTRDMPVRRTIKRLALRRFAMGYPPRKRDDTSMGDALNWEWIVHCATEFQGRIVIVSRDGDYGARFKGRYFLNDQLRHELKQRAGRKSVMYTHKLSDALKQLAVHVPEEEVKAEAETLKRARKEPTGTRHFYELIHTLSRGLGERKP